MLIKYFSVIIAVILLFTACTTDFSALDESNPQMRPLTKPEKRLVNTSQNFGLKLFREINNQGTEQNLFISPLSVSMALGMTMNGAAGETYEAMQQTLGFEGMSEDEINEAYKTLMDLLLNLDPKVVFEIANSIWPKEGYPVLDSFMEINQNYFDAEAKPLDFSRSDAVDIINNWISEKTHGKIENMLDYIPEDAVMYLINAIYFKGTWTYEFDKEATKTGYFSPTAQSQMECQMMTISGNWLHYFDDDVQIIDLPYGDSLFAMTILLPSSNQTVDELISNLTTESWESYISSLDYGKGTLTMPKIKLDYKLLMNDVLQSLGMGIAFSGGADFSRINGFGELFISRVIHQTFVQVDEEGTEAAAATIVEMMETSAEPHDTGFFMTVNRPYIFVIRDRVNNTILFIGKIIEPVWQE
jgi:serine protease inhibitor